MLFMTTCQMKRHKTTDTDTSTWYTHAIKQLTKQPALSSQAKYVKLEITQSTPLTKRDQNCGYIWWRVLTYAYVALLIRGSRKFCQRGSNSDVGFLSRWSVGGSKLPLKAGHHWLASETPFKWRFAGVPMMAQHWILAWQLCDFQGIRTSIAENRYIFVIFHCLSGSAHAAYNDIGSGEKIEMAATLYIFRWKP